MPEPQAKPNPEGARSPSVGRKKSRVRLLVACSEKLPRGVLARLRQSPIDVLSVPPGLGALALRRSDVLLLGDPRRMAELAQALERMDATTIPVIVLGSAPAASPALELTSLTEAKTPEGTADSILKTVVRLLRPQSRPARPTPDQPGSGSAEPGPEATDGGPGVHDAVGLEVPPLPKTAGLPVFSVGPSIVPPSKTTLPRDGFALGTDPMVSAQVSRSLMPESFPIQGSRWIVLDDNVARAHATACALEGQGALVEVSGSQPNEKRFEALRSFDAVGVLVPDADLETLGPTLGAFQRDTRLRFVRIVPLRFSELYDDRTTALEEETLKLLLLPHWQVEHDILRDLLAGRPVAIDHVGPAKLLRAGARLRGRMDVVFQSGGNPWTITLGDSQVLAIIENGVPRVASEALGCMQRLLELDAGNARLERNREVDRVEPLDHIDRLLDRCGKPRSVFGLELRVAKAPGAAAADAAPAPNPTHGDDLLTVPLAHDALSGQASLTRRARGALTPHLERLGSWTNRSVLQPAKRLGELGYAAARPWVLEHKKLSAGLLSVSVVGLLALLAVLGTGNQDASASARAGQAPPATNAAPVAEASSVTPRPDSALQAASPADRSAPEATVRELETLLQAPGERPPGCERWIGSAKVGRQPDQAMSAWRMARKSLMRGDTDQAEQRLCLSLHLDVRGPGTLDMIRFQFLKNDAEGALAWARWAVAERPTDPESKQLMADALHQLDREPLARALLLESMNLTAADVPVIRGVANRYANAAYRALDGVDTPQADRLFRRATTLDPKHARALAGRAMIALRAGDAKAAKDLATLAAEADPKCFEAHLVLGDAHQAEAHPEAARSAWLTAAALRPGTKEARDRLDL